LHWCGSGVRNSKYSTAPVFSLTHANTYALPGWVASTCLGEVLAASAAPTPIPANAITVAAAIIFSLGPANASPSRMIILSGSGASQHSRSSH
jgi:hypothetical protein